ncbi:MAG TPA: DUF3455 domain-containing protein [Albitalea sp.]|uniref:DUF3455 domain-containing protein n=1 Tax=Piscinibacter sp. TaxID=1903157 RepID=UPI002ED36C2F
MKRSLSLCLPLVLAACASQPSTPSVSVPDNLKPDASEARMSVLAARGVQIYECRAKKDDPAAADWAFVAPEAELFDMNGKTVGKHYAGPHWESSDGSKIVGAVKARADAPQAGAIPWLLLTTKSVGGAGAFSKVTSVQRVSTTGGNAPGQGCSTAMLGQKARVAYTADYVLYAPK